ncbi:large proline-rich protein bag6-B-like isoform X5 [Camellia sinensis]|uniref:large proline-rich protein bag6-B-like isoform X5 n=1 Tax=Camellia sinensis TaxID=4442 RepID=UPI001035C9CA|nr:large proline-rich protein bag6-B-like isoform X5 [Camellia sinensis]
MADQHSVEASSMSDVGGESSESMVELNIKTLDSQIYSFQVDKNMPVSLFKEKIASQIGLPVGQQRLIFRGKVLKDDHLLSEYHVENGHTLHLVARQPSESQPPSISSGETSADNGNRGHNANAAGPHNRIGQISPSVVLGTLNVGEQGEGIVPDLTRVIGAVLNSIGIGSQTATGVMGGVQPTVQFNSPGQAPQGNETEGARNNTSGQSQAGNQTQPGQALPSQNLPQVLQIPLGAAIPVPSLNAPIPDSLHTLSEFMNRVELALQNGHQPNQSLTNIGDLPTVELPSNARGLSTPETLSIVLRHAQHLLSGPTVAALSPFPLQSSLLFGGSAAGPSNPGTFGPIGIGAVPRHVNIHIHTAVGPRASNAEGVQGEHVNRTGPGDSGQTQPPPDSVPLSTVIAEVNSQIRNFVENMQSENQSPSGQSESSTDQNPSVRPGDGINEGNSQLRNLADNGAGEVHPERHQSSNNEDTESRLSSKDVPSSSSAVGSINHSKGETTLKLGDDSEFAPRSGQGNGNPERSTAVPLGLGLGGLQPKRRIRQQRSQGKGSDGATSSSPSQNQQTGANAQQFLQSLVNTRNTNSLSSAQMPPALGHLTQSLQMGGQGASGQVDAASAMSQFLHNPALNGLLAGVSEQTGVGSPNVFRNMLEQLTQNPNMMNTVNQIAQQFGGQDLGNMFSGVGSGQGGGIDLTSMVQQMMPMVSQVLGGGSAIPQSIPAARPDPQPQYNERRLSKDEKANDQNSQVDLQQVGQRIEHQNQPREIFRSIVVSAAHASGAEDLVDELCSDEGLTSEFIEILRFDIGQRLEGERSSAEKSEKS